MANEVKGVLRVAQPYQGAYKQELEDTANPADPVDNTTATQAKAPDNPEESTYKNRYDSLKTHYDREIVAARKRQAELEAQLIRAAQSNRAIPKTAEEFAAWRNQYPDLYAMMRTAIQTELHDTEQNIKSRIDILQEEARVAKRSAAESTLERLHPDFPNLRMDQKFHDWVKSQPRAIQEWLYTNEDDPLLAARAIDLYKADAGIKAAPVATREQKKADLAAAAQAVSTPASQVDPDTAQGKIWKMSEIQRMNRKQFELHEAEIDQARLDGRISTD